MYIYEKWQALQNSPATNINDRLNLRDLFQRISKWHRGGTWRAQKARRGDFSGAAAVTRALMNESGLHAASIGVTHTAAGYAALIGRASRRICVSFAKRSAYMHLGYPNRDPRRSALFSLGGTKVRVPSSRAASYCRAGPRVGCAKRDVYHISSRYYFYRVLLSFVLVTINVTLVHRINKKFCRQMKNTINKNAKHTLYIMTVNINILMTLKLIFSHVIFNIIA